MLGLFAFAVAGTAQGHEMLYDQDGYRLAVGVEAGLGGFAVGNVDTGSPRCSATAVRSMLLGLGQFVDV